MLPSPPLKLLLIEDAEDDVFFLTRTLIKAGYVLDYSRIETAAELRSCLSSGSWDLIITDHTLPEFNSIEAIRILNESKHDIPLIVLSGTIDQGIAIESMRLGARDFIMKDETSRLIPAIERELSEREQRRKILLSESKYKRDLQDIMQHSPAIIFIKDVHGAYTFINQKGEDTLRLRSDQILGKTDFDLYSQSDAQTLQLNDKSVLHKKIAIEVDENIKLHNSSHIFSTIKYPLFNESGDIYAICGISTDISEKKEQTEKLRRSQKMEAIGQLSGGIAHDFNNQLGIITGYLDLLGDTLSTNVKHKKWIDIATKASVRCSDLTRQLLAFSRRSPTETSIINMNNAFNELSDMIRRSVTPQVEVTFSLAQDLWNIEVDLGEFQDVILNLVINARDAMPDGGKLLIKTQNNTITKSATLQNTDSESNEFVQLLISDNGVGMDAKTVERIFEPFFTTKPVGKGTGLGLSMAYGFIHRYHGDINVYSEVAIGTTFRLSLPRKKSILNDVSQIPYQQALPCGNESILIVDDESELLNLAELYLQQLGYTTFKATNPEQALTLLSNNLSIELLFTDVVMPGAMNGYQLAEAATKINPDLKVQVTSGFTSETIKTNKPSMAENSLLDKPYSKAQLALCIRKLLDS